jgi:hypothetical protein
MHVGVPRLPPRSTSECVTRPADQVSRRTQLQRRRQDTVSTELAQT